MTAPPPDRRRRLRAFLRGRGGAVTIVFALGFPVVFLMFMATLELSFMMMRSTMLQRALDLTMRDLRLGLVVNPTVSELEARICGQTAIFPRCTESLALEFTVIDTATFNLPGPTEPCVLRSPEILAGRASETYDTGARNQMMVVRACMVVESITPDWAADYRLFARSAFVNEPN